MGTRLMLSTPPARTQSRLPAAMASDAEMTACIEEAHQRLMLVAGVPSPSSESRAMTRATLLSCSPRCWATPHIRSSTSSPSRPVSSKMWSMSVTERSSLRTSSKTPPALPNGVRCAAAMTG